MLKERLLMLSRLFRLRGGGKTNAVRLLSIVVVTLFNTSIASGAIPDDSYIAGYAAGVLKRDSNWSSHHWLCETAL